MCQLLMNAAMTLNYRVAKKRNQVQTAFLETVFIVQRSFLDSALTRTAAVRRIHPVEKD
jgi:hypothetical protein